MLHLLKDYNTGSPAHNNLNCKLATRGNRFRVSHKNKTYHKIGRTNLLRVPAGQPEGS